MPDFDTRKPQRNDEPRRPHIPSIANGLRSLLAASAMGTLSGAKALRSWVMADWFRSALIGGILFALIAIPVGVRSYSPRDLAGGTPGDLAGVCDDGQGASQQQGSGPVLAPDGQWTEGSKVSGPTRKPDGQWIESSEVSDPVLSPDGQWMLYSKTEVARASSAPSSATPEDRPYLFVMKPNGSCRYQLLDSEAYDPAWSPDSEEIAFAAPVGNGGLTSIFVMNAEGSGDPRRLTTHSAHEGSPTWSPDGEKIAFESDRLDGRELKNYEDIYVIKAGRAEGPTNRARRITDGGGWNVDPVWSKDGSEITYTRMEFAREGSFGNYGQTEVVDKDVYKVDADGSDPRLVER